jgi:DNA excision repair protein ERCC-2
VKNCKPEGATHAEEIDPPVEHFHEIEGEVRAFLSRYLEADIEIQPRDVVLRLCFYWSEFTEALEFVATPKHDEFFTTFRPDAQGGGTIRIVCCDAAEMLEAAYDQFDQVVGFSATLKPFDYYAKLSGLNPAEIRTDEFRSPFPKSQRKLLIIPEISTKFSDRERNYEKIAQTIQKVAAVRKGNYFAFFPSFDFMQKVLNRFVAPEGFQVVAQRRDMKAKEIQEVVDHLKSQTVPTLVFAVQGGVFSEGVDYPGETVIGAFVVGPPLPPFELEREKMRKYYDEHYEAGFDYAYTYPAMARAVQAAGRVIRSETDKGIIVLMDSRFLTKNYSQSMPADWFEETPRELVSRSILKDVDLFWNS